MRGLSFASVVRSGRTPSVDLVRTKCRRPSQGSEASSYRQKVVSRHGL
jgi:hypothetical protein